MKSFITKYKFMTNALSVLSRNELELITLPEKLSLLPSKISAVPFFSESEGFYENSLESEIEDVNFEEISLDKDNDGISGEASFDKKGIDGMKLGALGEVSIDNHDSATMMEGLSSVGIESGRLLSLAIKGIVGTLKARFSGVDVEGDEAILKVEQYDPEKDLFVEKNIPVTEIIDLEVFQSGQRFAMNELDFCDGPVGELLRNEPKRLERHIPILLGGGRPYLPTTDPENFGFDKFMEDIDWYSDDEADNLTVRIELKRGENGEITSSMDSKVEKKFICPDSYCMVPLTESMKKEILTNPLGVAVVFPTDSDDYKDIGVPGRIFLDKRLNRLDCAMGEVPKQLPSLLENNKQLREKLDSQEKIINEKEKKRNSIPSNFDSSKEKEEKMKRKGLRI